MDLDRRLHVLVMHEDPIVAAGLAAVLREQPGLSVTQQQPPEPGASAAKEVEVIVADYRTAMAMVQARLRDAPA